MTQAEYDAWYEWERYYNDGEYLKTGLYITDYIEKTIEGIINLDWGQFEGRFVFFTCEKTEQADKFSEFVNEAIKPFIK